MPQKQCPECKKKHGVRKKQCDCGYTFDKQGSASPAKPKKKKYKKIKETPGHKRSSEDLNREINGKNECDIPEPILPGTTVSNHVIYEHVIYEGLSESILNIPAPRIKDVKLRKKWTEAKNALSSVWRHLINE